MNRRPDAAGLVSRRFLAESGSTQLPEGLRRTVQRARRRASDDTSGSWTGTYSTRRISYYLKSVLAKVKFDRRFDGKDFHAWKARSKALGEFVTNMLRPISRDTDLRRLRLEKQLPRGLPARCTYFSVSGSGRTESPCFRLSVRTVTVFACQASIRAT